MSTVVIVLGSVIFIFIFCSDFVIFIFWLNLSYYFSILVVRINYHDSSLKLFLSSIFVLYHVYIYMFRYHLFIHYLPTNNVLVSCRFFFETVRSKIRHWSTIFSINRRYNTPYIYPHILIHLKPLHFAHTHTSISY